MILKHIPYSAYQIKTVNCHQLIQVPLKYFDNHLGFAGCRHNRSLLVWNVAENAFKLWVWICNGWIPKVWLLRDCTLLSQEFKHVFHYVPLKSHVQYVVSWDVPSWMNKEEQLMKKSTIQQWALSHFKVRNVSSDLNLYSRDTLSAAALTWWIVGQMYWKILIAWQKRWDWSVHVVMQRA